MTFRDAIGLLAILDALALIILTIFDKGDK